MSRLQINGTKANCIDEMTLLNAGHGKSLDMYTYNDINYFYIGRKPEDSSNHFSLQIAKLNMKLADCEKSSNPKENSIGSLGLLDF